jgi:hypothetical protein
LLLAVGCCFIVAAAACWVEIAACSVVGLKWVMVKIVDKELWKLKKNFRNFIFFRFNF